MIRLTPYTSYSICSFYSFRLYPMLVESQPFLEVHCTLNSLIYVLCILPFFLHRQLFLTSFPLPQEWHPSSTAVEIIQGYFPLPGKDSPPNL